MNDIAADREAKDTAQRWLLRGDLPCLKCQYNMRGLVGPMVLCPECGHCNDLRDASLWYLKALPLGVRQREHWPAVAVGITLLMPFTLMCSFGMVEILIVLLAALAIAWLVCCIRWVRSCNDKLWALIVLAIVHGAAWSVIVGMITVMALDVEWPTRAVGAFAVVLGFASLALRRRIHKAEDKGVYRDDWRSWRVPAGDAPRPAGSTGESQT